MDIAKIINQRYPTRLFLPSIPQTKSIALSYSEDVGLGFRDRLNSMIKSMNIDLSLLDFQRQRVSIDISGGAGAVCMEAREEEDPPLRFRITDKDPVQAAAWTIYALATGQNWFAGKENQVSAKMFSLEQQMLARSLIDALNIHRSADMTPQQKKALEKSLREYTELLADEFADSAPSLRFTVVSEAGWKTIRGKWLKETTCRDLLRLMDCNPAEIEELDDFCGIVRKNQNYRGKIDKAVDSMLYNLRFCPMTGIEDGIKSARNILQAEFSELDENARMDLRQSLNMKCSPRILTASRFAGIFADFDKQIKEMALSKLRVVVLEDLTKTLLERYYVLYERATESINRMNLRSICYIKSGGVAPQRLNWQNLDKAEADSLQIECGKWQDLGGAKLADIVQNGYPIPVGYSFRWLCGPGMEDMLNNFSCGNCSVVPGLNEQLLVIYMVKGG